MTNPMDIYDNIKKLKPDEVKDRAKAEADAFINSLKGKYTAENPAPNEIIQKGLEGILSKYQPKIKIPVASTSGIFSGRMSYAAGLASIAFFLGYLV